MSLLTKQLKIMRIFLIWLVIIACSVANGYFFSGFGRPEKFVFILCPSLVCASVLVIHRRVTKDWRPPLDPWTEVPHVPIFSITLFFSIFIVVLLFIFKEANVTNIVACASVAIASYVAYKKELVYTEKWENLSQKRR